MTVWDNDMCRNVLWRDEKLLLKKVWGNNIVQQKETERKDYNERWKRRTSNRKRNGQREQIIKTIIEQESDTQIK